MPGACRRCGGPVRWNGVAWIDDDGLHACHPAVMADHALPSLESLIADWRASYVAGDEARPCGCGGVVVASPSDPTAGMREHQRTDRHRRWSRTVHG